MLTVAVLGPLEVRRVDRPLRLPTGKATELLIRLALEAGRSVSDERLIEDLWGDAAAVTARNTLQSKVSQLRRGLGGTELVARRGGGYALEVDPAAVDALHVLDAAAAVGARRRAGDRAGVLRVAGEALGWFRGEPLVDAGEGEWLHPHRTRLGEVRLGLLEDRLAAQVDLEAGGDVIGELEALVERHPLREGLWVLLVTALYRAGRQADALSAHARIRRALADDLGLEPGPELRALELRILQQDETLAAEAPGVGEAQGSGPVEAQGSGPVEVEVGEVELGRVAAGPTVRARPASLPVRGNLPGLAAALVGRRAELTELDRLIAAERLVTVVGPAGVGKTRLATEVARRASAPDGAWIVRLDGAESGAVAQTVAETLQVPAGEPLLAANLAGRDLLLVLDNCEHVVGEAADLVGALLDASASLRVLATSQRPLGIDGEVVVPLAPLPPVESVELFATRAAAARPGFVLDEHGAGTVDAICRSLDGLPLAIELAAARVRSLSVGEISRRLDDRFALLQDPTSRQPPRRRGLAAALAWAYDLLFPDDQRGLWALACFSGGAPLPAAEEVLAALGVPRSAAVDVFARLVDRSLVTVEDVPELGGTVRYRLLDTIRSFALERLSAEGLDPVARAAHAAWVAALATSSRAGARGPGQHDGIAVARRERANVDAALAWAAGHDPELGVRIAGGFGWTWAMLGDGAAGAARVREALAASSGAAPAARFDCLLLATWLEAAAGDVERAESDLASARALVDERSAASSAGSAAVSSTASAAVGDLAGGQARARADVLAHLAFLRIQQGRPADAVTAAEASLDTFRASGFDWEAAASANLAAFALAALGDTERAAERAGESLRLRTALGDAWGVLHAEAMLGTIAATDGRLEEAAARLERAAAGAERLGFPAQAALHLGKLGRVRWYAGDAAAAIDTLRRAIEVAADCGDGRIVAASRLTLAQVLRATARDEAALVELRRADDWYAASGGGDGARLARVLLVAASAGTDPQAAVAALEAARAAARRHDDREAELCALDALARMAAEGGDLATAGRLLEEADALAAVDGHLAHDADRVDARRARDLLAAPVAGGAE